MSSVYIGNLPTNITREELTEVAQRYGEIGSVTLKSGFAFIVRRTLGDVDLAARTQGSSDSP